MAGTVVDMKSSYPLYWATVLRIVDGDTLVANVDLWPGLKGEYHVRVRGIQAPEIRGNKDCPAVKTWGEEAKRMVEKLYDVGGRIRLENIALDAFGRALADVSRWRSDRWMDLKSELLQRNLAVEWTPDMKDVPWCLLIQSR